MSNASSENKEISNDISQLQNQLSHARREIHNLRQQLISLNHVNKKEYELIHQKLQNWQCSSCKSNLNPCEPSEPPTTSSSSYDFQSKYIGTVSTNFPEKRGTPRQPGICGNMNATLTLDNNVFANPEHSLDGLHEFSHMWILFHFHRNDSIHIRPKVAPPRLNGIRTGVFATRSPHRPSPIGLSLVKINRILNNIIYFSGVDMVDQTPVLDIKPYIPHYDNPNCFNICNAENGIADSTLEPLNLRDLHLSPGETSTSDNFETTVNNSTSRVLDGEEVLQRDQIVGASISDNENSRMDESYYMRSNSRMGEREAPDGEEEEPLQNPQASLPIASPPEVLVRVPPWIDQPAVPRLTVLFKERAFSQLSQLGPEGEEKKSAITNVLREDPRSVFLRERWGSHCYVFRIAELYVSCKFNDSEQSVTVYQVFQNEVPPEGEERIDLI